MKRKYPIRVNLPIVGLLVLVIVSCGGGGTGEDPVSGYNFLYLDSINNVLEFSIGAPPGIHKHEARVDIPGDKWQIKGKVIGDVNDGAYCYLFSVIQDSVNLYTFDSHETSAGVGQTVYKSGTIDKSKSTLVVYVEKYKPATKGGWVGPNDDKEYVEPTPRVVVGTWQRSYSLEPDTVKPLIDLNLDGLEKQSISPVAGYLEAYQVFAPISDIGNRFRVTDDKELKSASLTIEKDGQSARYFVEKNTSEAIPDYPFPAAGMLEDGDYSFTVEGIDHVGQSTTQKYLIRLSRSLADVRVEAVAATAAEGWYKADRLEVRVRYKQYATDAAYSEHAPSGLVVSASVDNAPAPELARDQGSCTLAGDGIKSILITTMYPGQEPKAWGPFHIKLDSTAPRVGLVELTTADAEGRPYLKVTGDAFDGDIDTTSGVKSLVIERIGMSGSVTPISLVSEPSWPQDRAFGFNVYPEYPGDTEVRCRVRTTDAAGNLSTLYRALKINRDSLAPQVSIEAPAFARSRSGEYAVNMRARVANYATLNMYESFAWVKVDGAGTETAVELVKVSDGEYTLSYNPAKIGAGSVGEGRHSIKVRMRTLSNVSNSGTSDDAKDVIFDGIGPEIDVPSECLSATADYPASPSSLLQYEVSARDGGSGIEDLCWSIEEGPTASTASGSILVTVPNAGPYSISLTAHDKAGNETKRQYLGLISADASGVLFAESAPQIVVRQNLADERRILLLRTIGETADSAIQWRIGGEDSWRDASLNAGGGAFIAFPATEIGVYSVQARLLDKSTGNGKAVVEKQVRVNQPPSDVQVHFSANPARLGEEVGCSVSFTDGDSTTMLDGQYVYSWKAPVQQGYPNSPEISLGVNGDAKSLYADGIPVECTVTDRWGDFATGSARLVVKTTRHGTLACDETWTGAQEIDGTVIIPSGVTLTIDDGDVVATGEATSVHGVPGYNVRLVVQNGGCLLVRNGSSLTKDAGFGAAWGGILAYGSSRVEISDSSIQGATQAIAIVGDASIQAYRALFEGNVIGIHAIGARPILSNCAIENSKWYGLKEEGGAAPQLTSCAFADNTIDYFTSDGSSKKGSDINAGPNSGNTSR